MQEKSSTVEQKVPQDFQREFAELCAIAHERGWKNTKIADIIHKKRSLVTMILNNKSNATEAHVAFLRSALLQDAGADTNPYPMAKDTAALLHDLADLDDTTRTHVVAAVRQMVAVYPKIPRRRRTEPKG